MKFIDEAKIQVQAGRGGDGCISFRREKFVPYGGPDGGDGGHGGDVIIKTDPSCSTLLHLRYHSHLIPEDGVPGGTNKMSGRNAKSLEIRVPVGTLIKSEDNGVVLADLDQVRTEVVIAPGGKGGLGNCHFVRPNNQAPRRATKGKPGTSLWLQFELKLMADVGIVGFPNAGKSTLLSRISNAKPKIADYPFTTLTPQLGVVKVGDMKTVVVADIPGLIEGAHMGAGLGHRFLKHIERTRVLLHVLDVSEPSQKDPLEHYNILRSELQSYNPDLLLKPHVVALNKTDINKNVRDYKTYFKKKNIPVFAISSVTGEGINSLLTYLHGLVSSSYESRKSA